MLRFDAKCSAAVVSMAFVGFSTELPFYVRKCSRDGSLEATRDSAGEGAGASRFGKKP
jgi:hypothetical protein